LSIILSINLIKVREMTESEKLIQQYELAVYFGIKTGEKE
tara:strand:- start:988 stop:1107 length:120 start_codon:yes stop_codon:yes gene_type:complete